MRASPFGFGRDVGRQASFSVARGDSGGEVAFRHCRGIEINNRVVL